MTESNRSNRELGSSLTVAAATIIVVELVFAKSTHDSFEKNHIYQHC